MHSRLWAQPMWAQATGARGVGYKPIANFGKDDLSHQTNAIFLHENDTGNIEPVFRTTAVNGTMYRVSLVAQSGKIAGHTVYNFKIEDRGEART